MGWVVLVLLGHSFLLLDFPCISDPQTGAFLMPCTSLGRSPSGRGAGDSSHRQLWRLLTPLCMGRGSHLGL